MPSEDIATGDGTRPAGDRAGGGHAAARRTLRSRLRTPVGKAIVLAAMPSAALLGMGIGSPLAKAEPQPPPNPFQDRPCVEMPDGADGTLPEEPAPEEAPPGDTAGGTAEDEPDEPGTSAGTAAETEPGGGAAEDAAPGAPAPADDADQTDRTDRTEDAGDADDTAGTEDAARVAEEPEDEPTDDATTGEDAPAAGDPWDPLGIGQGLEDLGRAVGDLLTPGRGGADDPPGEGDTGDGDGGTPEAPAPPPTQPGRPEDPAETPEMPGDDSPGGEPGLPEEPEEPSTDDPADPADPAAEAPGDGGPGATTAPADERPDEGAAEQTAPDDPFAPDAQGRLPYPCPEERGVPGTDETTPVVLPDEGWYLEATYLTLRGLDYEGVVNVTTSGGHVKQALKFTADQLDIGDLHQIVDGDGGLRYHVGTAPGSNSTFRNGRVTMYTERLQGNLFGVIPVVFDPEHEPPLDIAFAFFTDVFVHQAGQFGGDLTLHGMEVYTTRDGPTPVPE